MVSLGMENSGDLKVYTSYIRPVVERKQTPLSAATTAAACLYTSAKPRRWRDTFALRPRLLAEHIAHYRARPFGLSLHRENCMVHRHGANAGGFASEQGGDEDGALMPKQPRAQAALEGRRHRGVEFEDA